MTVVAESFDDVVATIDAETDVGLVEKVMEEMVGVCVTLGLAQGCNDKVTSSGCGCGASSGESGEACVLHGGV